jgi:hypothetical protein
VTRMRRQAVMILAVLACADEDTTEAGSVWTAGEYLGTSKRARRLARRMWERVFKAKGDPFGARDDARRQHYAEAQSMLLARRRATEPRSTR